MSETKKTNRNKCCEYICIGGGLIVTMFGIILILFAGLRYNDVMNLEKTECNVTSIDYPTVPYSNNTADWVKCQCRKGPCKQTYAYSNKPCPVFYTELDGNTSSRIYQMYGYEKKCNKIVAPWYSYVPQHRCTVSSQCDCGSGNTERYLEFAQKIYDDNIDQLITCYIDQNTGYVYANKTYDNTSLIVGFCIFMLGAFVVIIQLLISMRENRKLMEMEKVRKNTVINHLYEDDINDLEYDEQLA